MAETIITVLSDDLDGSKTDVRPVRFTVDGQHYRIDLSTANRERFHEALQPFVDHARRDRVAPARAPRPDRKTLAERRQIRDWAAAQGLDVPLRGPISDGVRAQWAAAQQGGQP